MYDPVEHERQNFAIEQPPALGDAGSTNGLEDPYARYWWESDFLHLDSRPDEPNDYSFLVQGTPVHKSYFEPYNPNVLTGWLPPLLKYYNSYFIMLPGSLAEYGMDIPVYINEHAPTTVDIQTSDIQKASYFSNGGYFIIFTSQGNFELPFNDQHSPDYIHNILETNRRLLEIANDEGLDRRRGVLRSVKLRFLVDTAGMFQGTVDLNIAVPLYVSFSDGARNERLEQ